jgi:hypothetical protein
MDKKTKLILGGLFIAAGVGLYIWNKNKDKDDAAAPPPTACNEGETPCPNNPSICYVKGARYKVFPCDVVQGQETGTPIGEPNVQPTNENGGLQLNTR